MAITVGEGGRAHGGCGQRSRQGLSRTRVVGEVMRGGRVRDSARTVDEEPERLEPHPELCHGRWQDAHERGARPIGVAQKVPQREEEGERAEEAAVEEAEEGDGARQDVRHHVERVPVVRRRAVLDERDLGDEEAKVEICATVTAQNARAQQVTRGVRLYRQQGCERLNSSRRAVACWYSGSVTATAGEVRAPGRERHLPCATRAWRDMISAQAEIMIASPSSGGNEKPVSESGVDGGAQDMERVMLRVDFLQLHRR